MSLNPNLNLNLNLNPSLATFKLNFENKCKEVLQFYYKKAWINTVT